MNCINHPDTPVASYCQNCGKALCSECTRPVGGFIYCEQCLAAKVGVPGAQPGAPFPSPFPPTAGPNPGLATLLGFIPGVGAMYNGQFVKAMIHVLVFVILVGITGQHDFFGFFIAAWILYQVFDANQTAKARRDGLPLPDPFGLNELANRIGTHHAGTVPPIPPIDPVAGYTPPPPSAPPAASFVGGAYAPPPPPGSSYSPPPPGVAPYPPPPGAVPYPPVSPFPDVPPNFADTARRNEPIGAIVLIALGMIFLLGTLGIFHFDWIGRGWPLIIIVVGLWLFFKRARENTPSGGGQ
jgi:TM2 domain-containing membrane protein YozV